MNEGTVAFAYLHPGHYASCFAESLVDLLFHDALAHQRIVPNGKKMGKECGSSGIVDGRNLISRVFLDETECEWLFFVDSDMGFAPDTVDRLIAAADPILRPVVGALCFAQKTDGQGDLYAVRYRATPTLYKFVELEDAVGFAPLFDYPRDQLVNVGATGAACVLIHRSVLEKVRDKYGDTWWSPITHPKGTVFSEDLSFCVRVAACDLPMHVHTGVKTTHHKGGVYLDEETYDRAETNRGCPPPASEPVAVIVPVMGRAEHAEPFMRSLRASTGLAHAYAVCQDSEDHDVVSAWIQAGADVLKCDAVSFAAKVNHGYRETGHNLRPEPWLFLVGSDVRFRPGWLDHAQDVAHRYQAQVVGTNDLGNPRVLAGEHATHILISRSYIDTVGASWDPPGTVCHEGYRHWYVDDEIVAAAKQRGVWQMALSSVVEHLHPAWGKGIMDEVYELGQQSADKDRRLFEWRVERHVRAA